MRISSQCVALLAHRLKKTVRVRRECENYELPEDSNLAIDFCAINRDPKVWQKPHEFWPEHFYAADENKVACIRNVDRVETRLLPYSLCMLFH